MQQGPIAEADAELRLEVGDQGLPFSGKGRVLRSPRGAGSLRDRARRRGARGRVHRQAGLRSTRMALCPPNPNALDIATSTRARRGVFGM